MDPLTPTDSPATDSPAFDSQATDSPATDSTATRVRVVLGEAARARKAGPRAELAEQSQVGEALLRGLIRAQLGLALRLAAVVAVGLGGLPLLFAVAPSVAGVRTFGISLPWLLLGLAAYPFLFTVGFAYVRLAERTEADFTDLVERPES